MNIIMLLIKLVPTIVSLVGLAEKLYSDKPESGAEKKSFVMAIVQALSGGASAVFTGGAAETWQRIEAPIGTIIDAAASIAFPHADPNDPRYTNP